jgi:peptidoglycan/LPS O-acetylase OafA/YrhL
MKRTRSFDQIDVLRGFAALSVVVLHSIAHFDWQSFPATGVLSWFRLGWMGVDLFFVISGFVIALSAFAHIQKLGATGFRKPFMMRRIARITPLYYLTGLVFLVFVTPEVIHQSDFALNLISHLGFFHNTFWKFSGAINGVNWTIGVEMQFYLLIALTAPFLRNCRWWLIPLIAFIVAWVWRFGAYSLVPIDPVTGPFIRFVATVQLPGVLDQFAIGVLLARFVMTPQADRIIATLSRHFWVPIAVATLGVWAMMYLFWLPGGLWETAWKSVFWRTFESAGFGLVVLAACCLNHRNLLRWTTPFRYLGTISYGIYLWHLPVILTIKKIEGLSQEYAFVLTVAATVTLASLSWHFFEKRFLGPSKKAAPPASPAAKVAATN